MARPLASVLSVAVPDNCFSRRTTALACSVTGIPAVWTALPVLSWTCTVTAGVMVAPAAVSTGCWTNASLLALPGTLVRLKRAGPEAAAVVAVTWNVPVCELAVMAGETATPSAPEVTVVGPENVTLAPLAGAAKVTEALAIGLWYGSSTLALRVQRKARPRRRFAHRLRTPR